MPSEQREADELLESLAYTLLGAGVLAFSRLSSFARSDRFQQLSGCLYGPLRTLVTAYVDEDETSSDDAVT